MQNTALLRVSLMTFPQSLAFRLFAISALLSFPFTWMPTIGFIHAQHQPEHTQVSYQSVFDSAETISEHIPTHEFQVNAQAKRLEKDPLTILNWVQENTRYVPYEGCLKGARGTLMANQGNSLDRALLLQQLLNQWDLNTRLVEAKTNPATRVLLKNQRIENSQTHSIAITKNWVTDEMIPTLSAQLGVNETDYRAQLQQADQQRTDFAENLQSQASELSQSLQTTLNLQAATKKNATLRESSHYWVQVKSDEANGVWQNLCCDFGQDLPEAIIQYKNIKYYDGIAALPKKVFHQMDVKIKVSQTNTKTGKITTKVALKETLRTATYGHRQLSWGFKGTHAMDAQELAQMAETDEEGAIVAFRESLLNENEWIPIIKIQGQQTPIVDKRFNANGVLSKADPSAEEAFGQSMKNSADRMSSVFDVGSTPKKTNTTSVLSGVTVEYTFSKPGSRPIVETRPVFQIDPSEIEDGKVTDTAAKQRAQSLSRSCEMYLQTGIVPQVFAEWSLVDRYQSASMAYRYLQKSFANHQDEKTIYEGFAKIAPKIERVNIGLISMASQRLLEDCYLPSVNVICSLEQTRFFSNDVYTPAGLIGIDIVSNKVAAIPNEGANDTTTAFGQVFKCGVADTLLESMSVDIAGLSSVDTNAAKGFLASETDNWIPVTKAPETSNQQVNDAITADLKKGYQIYADQEQDFTQWWRVDAKTGEILGMVHSEMGIAGGGMAEVSLLKWISFTVGFFMGAFNFLKCMANSPRDNPNIGCAICFLICLAASVFSMGTSVAAMAGGINIGMGQLCKAGGLR